MGFIEALYIVQSKCFAAFASGIPWQMNRIDRFNVNLLAQKFQRKPTNTIPVFWLLNLFFLNLVTRLIPWAHLSYEDKSLGTTLVNSGRIPATSFKLMLKTE